MIVLQAVAVIVVMIVLAVVMIVVMIESTGMFLALGEMVNKPVSQADLTRGLRTDGVGTFIGGVFNTFPYTSFSQNVGLVGITGVRSRWVCVAGGFIMIALGLVPKMAALVEAVPPFVLGMNMFIVAISVAVGMIPLVAPTFFRQMPHSLHPLLESGILLSALMAVLLNVFFNGLGSADAARQGAAGSAAAMDHA